MGRREWAWLIGLGLAFAPGLLAMSQVWRTVSYQSHGFLVPLFSAAMFHANRDRVGAPGRHPAGFAVLAASLAMTALAAAGGSPTLQGVAFVSAVAGVVLLFWGRAGVRAFAFPIVFLVFMVPLPPEWVRPAIVALQLGVSETAVGILHTAGFSVIQLGNTIELPGGELLFVGEACSGITSIVTLTPLAVLLAYLVSGGGVRAAVLIASVLPLALLGNLVRVLATVVAARRFGVELTTGSALHEMAGLLTFAAATLGLLLVAHALGGQRGPRLVRL